MRVLIVGGVACGPKAAARLRRLDPSAEITVLEMGSHISYGACGIPYYVAGLVGRLEDLFSTPVGVPRDETFFKKNKAIEFLTMHRAERVDPRAKAVEARDLRTGELKVFPYDKLVIATGSTPFVPPIPGLDLENVFTRWDIEGAKRLKDFIDSERPRRAVMVGAGLIGMEMAEALRIRGLEVTVVEALSWPLPKLLDEEMGLLVQKKLEASGVRFVGGARVLEVEGEGARARRVRTDAGALEADLVLVAVGVRPNVELARQAGAEIGSLGGIRVDEHMRTSIPDVYAGGDCVESRHLVSGRYVYQPMGSTANRHGRTIADNIAGIPSRFKGVLGTAVVKVFETTVARTGLSEREAEEAGFKAISSTITALDKAHYYPGAKPITIKLVLERGSGRILGAQIVGEGVADKRIDVLASAVWSGMTVDELADLDLAYSPPYSSALDPLTHAANTARNKLAGLLKGRKPTEARELVEEGRAIILDVRTPKEVEEVSLPYEECTCYVPLGKLREMMESLPRDREIIATCKISSRAWDAVCTLKGIGIEEASILEGGVVGWPFRCECKGSKEGDERPKQASP